MSYQLIKAILGAEATVIKLRTVGGATYRVAAHELKLYQTCLVGTVHCISNGKTYHNTVIYRWRTVDNTIHYFPKELRRVLGETQLDLPKVPNHLKRRETSRYKGNKRW